MGKLKNPHPTDKKGRINVSTTEIDNFQHPVFCFKYLHKDHDLDKCKDEEKKCLIEKLVKLSSMNWQDIQLAPKHDLGSEKIHVDAIKKTIPDIVTEDVTHLLAMRFDGTKPFVGHRNKFIFHIFYIDRDYSVYKHS